ncbi:MAG: hypothetical protein EOP92_31195, partial [Lysobacteraceae bacterium]
MLRLPGIVFPLVNFLDNRPLPTMHFPHRPPLMAFALKTVTAAVASAVILSPAAHAAGLGKLTVLSALGQPLRAE